MDKYIHAEVVNIYVFANRIDKAIEYLEKVLESEKDIGIMLLELIELCLNTSKYEKAAKYLQIAEKNYSENSQYLYLKASYCFDNFLYEEGLEVIDRALEIKPGETDFIFFKSELIENTENCDTAINYIKSVFKEGYFHVLFYYRLAGLYLLKDEPEIAFKYLNLAVENDSKYLSNFVETFPEVKAYNQFKSLLSLFEIQII